MDMRVCRVLGHWVWPALTVLTGCATVQPPPTQLPEVRPGYVAGYLRPEQLPDVASVLPPPPAEGSAAYAADQERYKAASKLHDTPRWKLAQDDAELRFPKAAQHFSCTLDIAISAEATPHLNMLLRRIRMDASRANDASKAKYKRPRPYMVTREPSCTPSESQRPDAYPSGHASIGWAWALALAEIDPDRADAILARGYEYGQSRVICRVHWQSDIEAGRVVGAASVSRLHSDPVFLAQMAEAKKEIAAVRAAGRKSPRDCEAERGALALKP
ncbi:MAG: phosphatase PAP2 family protein [Usitatibacter sp.]